MIDPAEVSLNSPLVIRICRHTFPDGRHCQGPAVRGRACCRHHLDARARRLASFPRLCVPMNPRDLASNRSEVLRVVNSGAVDLAAARRSLWTMELTAALPAEPDTRRGRTRNPNVFYYVPLRPLFSQSCIENPSQVPENTREQGMGVHLGGTP